MRPSPSLALGLALPLGTAAAAVSKCRSGCTGVSFTVDVTAQNIIFADQPDRNNETDIFGWYLRALSGTVPTAGLREIRDSFVARGTYCSPPAGVAAKGALEVLVAGATYAQEVWYGFGVSDINDYTLAATRAGYHTLTVDRLGHGVDPRRPDPIDVAQIPLEAEILHGVIEAVRAGPKHPKGSPPSEGLPRAFDKVVYLGHSLGSGIGNVLVARHPSDADVFVNTGFSIAATFVDASFRSAASVDPVRFAGLALGYMTTATFEARRDSYYAGDFDGRVARADWERKDTASLGELASFALTLQPAAAYVNPVLMVTGSLDKIACSPKAGVCEDVLRTSAEALYPNSTRRDVLTPEVGHDLTLHRLAPQIAADIHQWLDSVLG